MEYPRVTRILEPYERYEMVNPDTLQASQVRGTMIHIALASYAKGLWSPPVPEEWQGYLDSGKRWLNEYVGEIHLIEETLVDKDLGFQGKIDLLVTMIDGALTLPDYKTARTKSKIWIARMSAYRHLCIKNGWPVQRVGTLRLKADGSLAIFDHYPINDSDFIGFHSALIAYKFFTS